MEHSYKTLVSVGNAKQSFLRLLEAVEKHIDLLPQPVLIQCGNTIFTSKKCDVKDFISMDLFVQYVQQAELLILHAGAGSVLHTVQAGKCPIIMPRTAANGEHVNDHQVGFAETLHNACKVFMIQHESELPNAIQEIKNRLAAPIEKKTPAALKIIQAKLDQLLA